MLGLGFQAQQLADGGLGTQSAQVGTDGVGIDGEHRLPVEGHLQPRHLALRNIEHAEDKSLGEVGLADAHYMAHRRRVVGHARLVAHLHGKARVHPSHHEIGLQGSRRVGIAGEDHLAGPRLLQLGQRQLDILCRAYIVGNLPDVARMLSSGHVQAEVGAQLHAVVLEDMAAQVHVQGLGRQVASPLQEQAHAVALHGEARALQGGTRVLDGGRTVAHAHGDVV